VYEFISCLLIVVKQGLVRSVEIVQGARLVDLLDFGVPKNSSSE